jgi:hypothetical protein
MLGCEGVNYAYRVDVGQGDWEITSITFDGFTLDSATPGFDFPYHIFNLGYGLANFEKDLATFLQNEDVYQCCEGIDTPVRVNTFFDANTGFYTIEFECISEQYFPAGFKPLSVATSDGFPEFEEVMNDPECCTDDCRNYQYTAIIRKSEGNLTEISLVGGVNLSDAPQMTFPYDLSLGTERTRLINEMDAWLIANDYGSCCADPENEIVSVADVENDFDPAFETGLVRLTITCVASTLPGFLSFDTVDGGGLFMKVEVPEDNCCAIF